MYYVKVEGKTLADLKHGLETHLAELEDRSTSTVSTKTNVKLVKSLATTEEELDDDGMEEVESPYSNTVPSVTVPLNNEVDSEGLPWDSRIHSSSKNKMKNGAWKVARGADENLVFKIKQELRSRVAQAPVAEVVVPVVQHVAPPIQTYTAPVAQAPVAAPLPPMQNSGHTLSSFVSNFPLVIAQLISNGKIPQTYINQLKTHFGATEIWAINDEQKAMCFGEFVKYGFIQQVG